MPSDDKIFFFLNNLAGQSPAADLFFVFFAGYLQYALIALFFFFAYRSRRPNFLFVPLISAIIARFGVVALIRFFYHRPRPFSAYQIIQLVPEMEFSFPSGHSAFFFALAAGIYLYDKKWGAWFFAAAALMNIARIIAGVHYPSDIAGGAVIGIISGLAVKYLLEKNIIFRRGRFFFF